MVQPDQKVKKTRTMSDKENYPLECVLCKIHKSSKELFICYICKAIFCDTCKPEKSIGERECVTCVRVIGHFCTATCRETDNININVHCKSPRCIYCRGLIERPYWYKPAKKVYKGTQK